MTIHPRSQSFGAALPARETTELARAVVDFSFASTLDELALLEVEWNALFDRAGRGSQLFQTHPWVWQWARVYLKGLEHCGGRLAVLTARQESRLVMVWPLVVSRGIAGRVVEFAGCPLSQYGDVVIEAASDDERLALLWSGWQAVQRELRPDLVVLGRVREDASIEPLVAELGGVACALAEAPWLPLAAACDGVGFEARQKGAAKRNRRRLMRRLEQGGAVTAVARFGSAEAAADGLAALSLKRDWLDRAGLASRAFADGRIEDVFATALGDRERSAGTAVFSLSQAGRPVAYAIGIACKARLSLHVIVHDPAFDDCGAGLLNIEACLRHAERAGFEEFDLLPPRADYKMKWATGTVAVADRAIGMTLRGRIVARLWHGLLRDRAKAWVASLPSGIRRRLGPPRTTAAT